MAPEVTDEGDVAAPAEGPTDPNPASAPVSPDRGAALPESPIGSGIPVSPDPEPEDPPLLDASQAAPVASGPAPDAEIRSRIDALGSSVQELVRLRNRDIELADRMHAEITRLRTGEIRTSVTPLLKQLIRLVDTMDKLDRNAGSDMQAVREQLVQILDTTIAVSAFSPELGTAFDSKTQLGAERRDTNLVDLDGTIAECVRLGFQWDDGPVIRAAEVAVHRYVVPTEPPPTPDEAPVADPLDGKTGLEEPGPGEPTPA